MARPWALALISVLVASPSIALADPRPFTFSNDTYPVGKGEWEYEQWVTYAAHKEDDSGFHRVTFRHEFEFGLAENFDLAVYVPTWHWEDSDEASGTQFDSVDIEGVVYLSNPVEDFLGLGLYNELKIGEESLGIEHKLLVQKDVGNWIFLYNLVLETEIEGVFRDLEEDEGEDPDPTDPDAEEEEEGVEVEGEMKHTLGVAYGITDSLFLGGEVIVTSEFENWHEYEKTTVYAGPVISYQGDPFWITVTPTYQLTDEEDEADFQVRLIAGIQF